MTELHAPYAPSAMHRIVRCPASVRATAHFPDIPTPYSLDGREAHDMLAYALVHRFRVINEAMHNAWVEKDLPQWEHRADTFDERVESLSFALETVFEILDAYEDAVLYIETRVEFPSEIAPNQVWGTADIVIYVPSLKLVYVLDYKHGAGVYVSIEDNEQLGTYAAGALNTLQLDAELVVTGIIQPRVFSEWGMYRIDTKSSEYYRAQFFYKIETAIGLSIDPNAPFVPGEKQCQFCPLKANCPAREAAALAVVSETFKSVKDVTRASLPVVSQLPVDRLAFIMQAAVVLRGWLSDVENTAYAMAAGGTHIPGFKMVEAQPRRRWYGDEEEIALMLMSMAGVTEAEVRPPKLLGITEAERLVKKAYSARAPRGKKKKAAEEAGVAFANLTIKDTSGNLSLVPDDDKRPAVNVAQVTFQNVQIIPPTQE